MLRSGATYASLSSAGLKPRVLVILLLLASGAPTAWAVCNAPSACRFSDLPASCCGATSCTLDGTITVVASPPGAVCNFDFGARNVTLTASGHLLVGSSTVTITAGSFTVKGDLSARGASPDPGGNLTITTVGHGATAFSSPTGTSNAKIDLSGFGTQGGGTLTVHADGAVLLDVGPVNLDGLEAGASGGTLRIDSTAGAIRVNVPVTANAGLGGSGGTVSITAPGDLTVTKQMFVNGGSAGGSIDLDARGTLLLDTGSILQASGLAGGAGDGGTIDVVGAALVAGGELEASGGSDPEGAGGSGGSLALEARTGVLDLASGDVVADGAPGGDGGQVTLTTDTLDPDGTLTINARVSAVAPASLAGSGGGGSLDATAAGHLFVQKTVDVSGAGGATGSISLTAARDVNLTGTLLGNDPGGGGGVDIDSGHDTLFGADVLMRGTTTGGGDGGSITASARNDVRVLGFKTLDVSGTVAGVGGSVDLEATGNVVVSAGANLIANGGSAAGSRGGSITLLAGDPDTTGDLTINGRLTARGTSSTEGAEITLRGCRVLVSGSGAIIDSTGDAGSTSTVTARSVVQIQNGAQLKATARNTAIYPSGSPPQVAASATVSPPFGPCTCPSPPASPACCAKPVCTDRNVPAGCLVPCPQCGNGRVDAPWETCDPGTSTDRCGANPPCSLHCRILNCSDANVCTTDDCDNLAGCFNSPVPDGSPCDDATVCNGRETCRFGSCAPGRFLDCNDDNPCTEDCDPMQGCVNRPISGAGIPGCDDGNACNGLETCVSGSCQPGTAVTCPQGEVCDPASGRCITKPCGRDAECSDGNPCNGTETCRPEVPRTCQSGTPLGEGAACPDGTVCNGSETCQGGVCVHGTAPDCDDGDLCTDDGCDPALGCQHTAVPGCCRTAADCDDQNPCTTDACGADDRCTNVVDPDCCQTDADCDDRNPCTADSACVDRRCTHTPLSGPQPGCGDACAPAATCVSGTCDLGAPLLCPDDGDVCTTDLCDPVTGCTIHQPIDNCCHTPADCDDGNPCIDDACVDTRCTHTLRSPDCKPCTADTDCDPVGRCAGAACGSDDTCTSVTPPNCSDNDPNTRDVCVLDATSQPQCQHQCLNATACDDGNRCNGEESCTNGTCVAGVPPACDVCESCEPASGCRPTTGVAAASCQAAVIADALAAAPPTDLRARARRKLGGRVAKIRAELEAAAAAEQAGRTKRAQRLRAGAKRQLGGLGRASAAALRRHQIAATLAALVEDRASRAMAVL